MSSSEQPTHRSGSSGGSVKGILKKESPGPEAHPSRQYVARELSWTGVDVGLTTTGVQ